MICTYVQGGAWVYQEVFTQLGLNRFALNTFKTMSFALKMMSFAFKTMSFVLNMMNAGARSLSLR